MGSMRMIGRALGVPDDKMFTVEWAVGEITDCVFDLKGRPPLTGTYAESHVPRVVSITDRYHGAAAGHNNNKLLIWNVRSKVTPNGSPKENCWDVEIKWPETTLKFGGGMMGSDLKGGFSFKPRPTFATTPDPVNED